MATVTNGSAVLFKNGTQTNYNKLGTYDANTLYFTDDNNLYLGGNLIGSNVKDADFTAGVFTMWMVGDAESTPSIKLDFSDVASSSAVGEAIVNAIATAKSEVIGTSDDAWGEKINEGEDNEYTSYTLWGLKNKLEGTIAESGVTSLNELTGDVEIVNGSNVSIETVDGKIQISSSYTDTNTITTVNGSSGTLTVTGGGDGIDVTTTGTSTVITNTGVTSLEDVTGDIDLVGSGSVSVSHDATAKTITITGVDTTYTNGSGISLSGTIFSTTAPTSAEVTGETDSEDIMTASISGNKLTLNVGALEDRLESIEDWQGDYVAPTIPVSSVNTKTGAVVLSGSDISTGGSSSYTSSTVAVAVDGLETRLESIEEFFNGADDTNSTLDKWHEVEDFLANIPEGSDLDDLITTASEGLNEVTVGSYTFGGDETTRSISITGGGATTVSATESGTVTISSTDSNTYVSSASFSSTTTTGPVLTLGRSGDITTSLTATIPMADGTTAAGVVTTTTQTFGGVKTFSSVPVCTTKPTSDSQLSNKEYVDDAIEAATLTWSTF